MLSELLSLPPAEQAHRLAVIAVEARQRKAAAVKQADIGTQARQAWEAVKPTLSAYGGDLKNLNIANPAVAATLGAGLLGGGSAVSEAMRSKGRRRWSNVALNAALGGALGGAGPLAVAGLRDYFAPPNATPDNKTIVQNTHDSAQAAFQTTRGALEDARLPAANKHSGPANTAIDATQYALGKARDNPLLTLGGAAAIPLYRMQHGARSDAAIRAGLERLSPQGVPLSQTLAALVNKQPVPTPTQPLGPHVPLSPAMADGFARFQDRGPGTYAARAVGLHGIGPSIPGVPPAAAREIYHMGKGHGGVRGFAGRAGFSAIPAILGAGADYLVRQSQPQP